MIIVVYIRSLLILLLAFSLVVTSKVVETRLGSGNKERNLEETNFDISLDFAQTILNQTTAVEGSEIIFRYNYDGPSETEFIFEFLDFSSCNSIISNPPLSLGEFVVGPGGTNHTFQQGVDIDQASLQASSIWAQDPDQTAGNIQFCFRVKLYYYGEQVNYHETILDAQIDLVEDSDFVINNVNTVHTGPTNTVDYIDAEYPIAISYCDDLAVDTTAPQSFSQGNPVQICVKLATQTGGVYVSGIDSLTYSSPAQQELTVHPITASNPLQTTDLDCGQVAGVCRMKFIIRADYFVNPSQPVTLRGSAILAFGVNSGRHLQGLEKHSDRVPSSIALQFESEIRGLKAPAEVQETLLTPSGEVFLTILSAAIVVIILFFRGSLWFLSNARFSAKTLPY